MLSASDKSESVNERSHTDQQKNTTAYSRGSPEVPMNYLGNQLLLVLLWLNKIIRNCTCVVCTLS